MDAFSPPEFEPDRAALILIDTQRQWVPMIPDCDRIVANIRTLLRLARGFGMPIVVAQHEGLRRMSLEGGMPSNELSGMVSEVWLGALSHILNQFHYDATADPAQPELVGTAGRS